MTNLLFSGMATGPARALVMSRSLASPPPHPVDHGIGVGVPPGVGRDARCLLVQMSCFTDGGQRRWFSSPNFARHHARPLGDSEQHRTRPLPSGLEWEKDQ